MYGLFRKKSGGILGDDMGLGKTFQVTSLLTGLMQAEKIKRVMIVAPVSVLPNWERELNTHLSPHISSVMISVLNSDVAKKKRLQILAATFDGRENSIVICSHQMVTTMVEEFSRGKWDYVVLDEGHVIKNPATKLFQSMQRLPSTHRLLLTGTPIQNKLEEFWAVVDWATKGKAFGTLQYFSKNIADPIAKGQNPDATDIQLVSANEAKKILSSLIRPIFLQRKKKDQPQESLKLPEKKELVLWITLSTVQRSMYEKYITSSTYLSAFRRTQYPVEVINYLKTLCRHPILLEVAEKNKSARDDVDGLVSSINQMSIGDDLNDEGTYEGGINFVFDAIKRTPDVQELMRGSVKLRVLIRMLSKMVEEGHRILVFSQSKLMLQIIQYVLVEYDFPSYRIDGSTSLKERQIIIDDFNNLSEDYTGPMICLLTTKACGTGITLTGADRVVIFDPSWNPAEDRQAVDRAFRIGQTRPVVVYRMIQASCVEEKIYEKQVFKEGLRVVGEKSASTERYVAGQAPLQELLNLGPANEVNLLRKLSNQLELLKEDKVDIIPGILGCSRHDELYKEDDAKPSAKPTNANTDSQKLQQQHLHYPPLQLQAKEKVVIDLTQSPLKPPADSVAPAITESSDEIFSPAVNNIRHYQRRPKISGLEDDDDEDNKSPIVSRAQDYEGESNPLDAKSNESATGLEDLLADIQIDEEEITPERIESCEDDPYFSPQEILNPILVSTSEIEDLKQHEVEQEELQVQGSDLEQGEIREENIVAIITEDHSSQAKTSESGLEDLFANICISNDIPEMSPIPGDANGLPVFATEGSALNLEEDFVDSREKDKRLENSDEYTSEHNIQESVEGTSIEVPSNDPSETTIILEATDHCSQSPSMLQESAILLDISSQDRTGTDCSEYYDGDSNTCLDMGILNLVEMKEIYQNQKAGGLVGSSQMKHSAHSTDQFMNPSIFSPNLILDPNSPALSNTSGIALNEASITRLEENVNEESTPICSNIDTTRRRRGKSTAKRNTSRLESLSQQTPSVYSTIKIKASSVSRTVNTTTAKKNRNSFLCLSVNSDTSDNSPPLINSAVIQPRESLDVDPRKQLTFDQDPDQNVNSSLTDLT